MQPIISVVIPTHAPNAARLKRTLAGLRAQSLPHTEWELVVVDNASPDPQLYPGFDLSWHPRARVVREEKLGLTAARLAGIRNSVGAYIIFVDDDNVLCANYLTDVRDAFDAHDRLGALGGKSVPEFEVEPEPWVSEFYKCLALRDCGEEVRIGGYQFGDSGGAERKAYPDFAPIGAGMSLRREVAEAYAAKLAGNKAALSLDRTGQSLVSGGDNDIILTALDAGWQVGYFPTLQLTHLIPAGRVSQEYLAKLNRAMSRSWIKVLDLHGIRTWPRIPRWTVLPRQLKAFLTYKAWRDATAYVRWQGACGLFEGLGALSPEHLSEPK